VETALNFFHRHDKHILELNFHKEGGFDPNAAT
jgi:hypothetical protein